MATAAPNPSLPLYYSALQPLNATDHSKMHVRRIERLPTESHAVPATVDEFALLQRHYPIVFSVGENPVPLALMGLNENVNVFFNDGKLIDSSVYVPAYMRRYPFLLARLRPDTDELSLCFDPTAGSVGDFEDGEALAEALAPPPETRPALPATLRAWLSMRNPLLAPYLAWCTVFGTLTFINLAIWLAGERPAPGDK